MNARTILITISVLVLISLIGCGEHGEDSNAPEISNSDSDAVVDGSYILATSDIDKYLEVMKEMKSLGDSMDENSSMVEAFSIHSDMRALLKKHDVDTSEFAKIQAAITTAMGAALLKKTAPLGENSALLKSLEKSPGMTPEKLADIRSKMKQTAAKANSAFASVPESNIKLVKSRMEDLNNLGR